MILFTALLSLTIQCRRFFHPLCLFFFSCAVFYLLLFASYYIKDALKSRSNTGRLLHGSEDESVYVREREGINKATEGEEENQWSSFMLTQRIKDGETGRKLCWQVHLHLSSHLTILCPFHWQRGKKRNKKTKKKTQETFCALVPVTQKCYLWGKSGAPGRTGNRQHEQSTASRCSREKQRKTQIRELTENEESERNKRGKEFQMSEREGKSYTSTVTRLKTLKWKMKDRSYISGDCSLCKSKGEMWSEK